MIREYQSSANTYLQLPEELGEEIDVEVKWTNENNGIGSYEFWGFKGYDQGVDYMDIYEIKPIFTTHTEQQQKDVLLFIETNWDLCSEQVEQNLMDYWNDRMADYGSPD